MQKFFQFSVGRNCDKSANFCSDYLRKATVQNFDNASWIPIFMLQKSQFQKKLTVVPDSLSIEMFR